MMLVKQGPKLAYSLQFTDYYAPDFTAADRAHTGSVLVLMQRRLN
jgi:hypothetical protein